MNETKRRNGAFTLVEIVATATILLVAIVPMLSTLFEHYRATLDMVNKVMAANYAKDVIDYLKSMPYEQLSEKFNGVDSGGNAASGGNFSMLPPMQKGFTREVSVAEFADEQLGPGRQEKMTYKIIKVTVNFEENGRKMPADRISMVGAVIPKNLKKQEKR